MTKRVRWEIDVDAATPEEAARQALAIQRKPDSTATAFDITDEQGKCVRVDLDQHDGVELLVCDNCGKSWTDYELEHPFPDIPDLTERIEPGGTVPAGECPTCGALVYPKRRGARVLVLLEGGRVQDVMADCDGVEVAVLNQDLEGADEADVVEANCGPCRLRGTLRFAEAISMPAVAELWSVAESAPDSDGAGRRDATSRPSPCA